MDISMVMLHNALCFIHLLPHPLHTDSRAHRFPLLAERVYHLPTRVVIPMRILSATETGGDTTAQFSFTCTTTPLDVHFILFNRTPYSFISPVTSIWHSMALGRALANSELNTKSTSLFPFLLPFLFHPLKISMAGYDSDDSDDEMNQ